MSRSVRAHAIPRRGFLGTMAAGAAWAALPSPARAQGADKRPPNLIVLMGDDCSAREIACYGHKKHQTPNLDALARTGAMFKTCWCTPLCSPTRAEIMTGRYGFRTRWYHNNMKDRQSLPTRNTIFAQFLKKAGYATAISGKWQLPGTQKAYGFDESCIWAYENYLPKSVKHAGAYEQPGKPSRYWHPCVLKNGTYLPTKPDDYGPDIFTDFVIDFAKRHRDRPFLAYYPMSLTHGPFYPTPDSLKPGAEKLRHDKAANFAANVAYMDKLVSRIVKALDDLRLRDNTILLFTTDNGTGAAGKGQAREIGCHVPMIVNGPGHVKPLGPRDELVDFSDVLPTLLDFAGTSLPEGYVVDGRSFAPLLRGEAYTPRDWIFSYLAEKRMLRDHRWLLEGNGKFYDCGDSRDGTGYRDVTASTDPEAVAARKRFEQILADKPAPKPDDPLFIQYQKQIARKKLDRKKARKKP